MDFYFKLRCFVATHFPEFVYEKIYLWFMHSKKIICILVLIFWLVARLVTVYVLHDTQGTAHSLSSMSILASLSLRLAFTLLVSAADRYKDTQWNGDNCGRRKIERELCCKHLLLSKAFTYKAILNRNPKNNRPLWTRTVNIKSTFCVLMLSVSPIRFNTYTFTTSSTSLICESLV